MITRIQNLKIFYGLSTRGLAVKCGMNQPTVDRILKGINAISANFITSILTSFPDVSAEWLLRGKGDMLISDKKNSEGERIDKLVDTIALLQDTINNKVKTIEALNERIRELESQLKK